MRAGPGNEDTGSADKEGSTSVLGLTSVTSHGTSVRCFSDAQWCTALSHLRDGSTPGFPVPHHLPGLLKLMCIESVIPSNHLILCHPLLLLSSVFPSIRIYSNETALHISWAKSWSFNFIISLSNVYSGLFLLGMSGFIPLLSKGL